MAHPIAVQDDLPGVAGLFAPACAVLAFTALPDAAWSCAGVLCLVLGAMVSGLAFLRNRPRIAGISGLLGWAVYMGVAILGGKPLPLAAPGQTLIFFTLWLPGMAALVQLEKHSAGSRDALARAREAENEMADLARRQEEELNRVNKSLFLEIRAHIEAEGRLRESEEKYRYLVNSLPEGIFILQDRKIVFHNPGLEALTGLGAEELKTMDPAPLMPGQGRAPDRQPTLDRPDGSTIIIENQWVDIRFKDRPARLYTVRDITERVMAEKEKDRLETELEKAKKMEAIGLMAAGVAHDLNNVLAGVVSTPDLLLMELPDDSGLRETVLTIKDSGKRASVIVDELLTLGKGTVGVREPVRLNEVVDDYLASPEFDKSREFHPGVRVDCRLDPELPGMTGSGLHMRKVVMNLVSNAMEAIRGSGQISLTTGRVRFMEKQLKGYETALNGEYIHLCIADTGPGIAAEDLERIFEPFYTKKILGRSGTGLGLSIVWNIVHDHKGYIQVKSSEAGTIFDIYLPAGSILQDEGKPDKIYTLSDYTGNDEKILVVDDEENQLKITSNMLRRMGYQVATVPSGEAAVEYAGANPVDLVILDMIMAPGIDGLETFNRLRGVRPGIRAVLVSGYSKTGDVDAAQASGAGAFLKKPFSLQTLGLAVKHELERQE
ncbi:MAG: response regulator [Desulfobacter sp.]|nr:MAG: response regulator [Desulfobacter sp.]